jgi:hypothetical protein
MSRKGSPRSSAKANATVTEVENGSLKLSVTGARVAGRGSDWLAAARESAALSAAPCSCRSSDRRVRESAEGVGAPGQRLGQLAAGSLRSRARWELGERDVETM